MERISRRRLFAGLGVAGAGVVVGLGAAPSAVAAPGRNSAATVIRNAKVWTGRPGPQRATAVAISREGLIMAVGDDAAVRERSGRDTVIYDAKGGTVMPGILLAAATKDLAAQGVTTRGKSSAQIKEVAVESMAARDFTALCVEMDKANWQVIAHAPTKAAVRTALDGFAAARKANGWRDNRHTITGIQAVDIRDLPRFKYGVIASLDGQMEPLRALHRAGATLAAGSTDQAWTQIRTATDRATRDVALRMHTIGAAKQLRQEDTKGTLGAGKVADLVVLDRDVLAVPLADINTAKARLTFVKGNLVHKTK